MKCALRFLPRTADDEPFGLFRDSRGPSTVTLMALLSVATCIGSLCTVIVRLKFLPKSVHTKRAGGGVTQVGICQLGLGKVRRKQRMPCQSLCVGRMDVRRSGDGGQRGLDGRDDRSSVKPHC